MPKETEEQKGKRSQAIQEGYKKAIETPLDTAKHCMKVLEMAPVTADKGNPNSVSDAGVGADMAAAGLRGAIMNIEINLGSIKDQDYVNNMKEEIKELHEKGENILKKVREEVDNKL
jgi:formiminotetrahydrofolate cyclodeaminase